MRKGRSFVSLALVLEHLRESLKQFGEALGDVVAASGVFLSEVVGVLPLMDVVVGVGVVHVVVVGVHPLADFQVPEPDAPAQSSQVLHFHPVVSEKLQDLVGVGVRDSEDILASDARVVRPVRNRPRVEVGVKSSVRTVTHRYVAQ
jgi:hypothetical protein